VVVIELAEKKALLIVSAHTNLAPPEGVERLIEKAEGSKICLLPV